MPTIPFKNISLLFALPRGVLNRATGLEIWFTTFALWPILANNRRGKGLDEGPSMRRGQVV